MATDMEAVIARLDRVVKLEVTPDDELSVQAILSLLPDALTVLQAAKAYVDARATYDEVNAERPRPTTVERGAALTDMLNAYDALVRAMKGETL